ncbi:hypothetical protein [Streptomyces sp. NPDC005795]|uniref:hypothetical protein n=1 Tax=Streptomyces sp. NPDC005795 TaxID=3154677 RepID=UPI0033C4BA94
MDSTFSQLAVAVDGSRYLGEEKGTTALREQAFRALVRRPLSRGGSWFGDLTDAAFGTGPGCGRRI